MTGDGATLDCELADGGSDERNVGEFGAMKLDIFGSEDVSMCVKLGVPGKS